MDKIANSIGLGLLPGQLPLIVSTTVFLTALFNFNKYPLALLFPEQFPKLSKHEQKEWQSYSISFLVCLFFLYCSTSIILDSKFSNDPLNYWNLFSLRAGSIANGYFIWDIIFCLQNNHGLTFTLHGILGFLVTMMGYTSKLHYIGACAFMYELSTPFLNLNYFLSKSGLKGTKIHLINGLLLLVTYLFARIIFGIYFTISTIAFFLSSRSDMNIFFTFMGIVLLMSSLGLNTFWFCKLVAKAIPMLKGFN